MSELHRKYNVTRVDGTALDVPCFVLELRPNAQATAVALRAFAEECGEELAYDLRAVAHNLERGKRPYPLRQPTDLGPERGSRDPESAAWDPDGRGRRW